MVQLVTLSPSNEDIPDILERSFQLILFYCFLLLKCGLFERGTNLLLQLSDLVSQLTDRFDLRIMSDKCHGLLGYAYALCLDFHKSAQMLARVSSISQWSHLSYLKFFVLFQIGKYDEVVESIRSIASNLHESSSLSFQIFPDVFNIYAVSLSYIGDRTTADTSFKNALSTSSDQKRQVNYTYNKSIHDSRFGDLQTSKKLLEAISRVSYNLRFFFG